MPQRPLRAAFPLGLTFVIAAALWVALFSLRGALAGDGFDFVRWEVQTLPGTPLFRLAAPFRHDPSDAEALAAYFSLRDPSSPEAARLENTVEAAIASRIRTILALQGIGWDPTRGTLFPPVNFELAPPPNALVISPRAKVQALNVTVLRADLTPAEGEALERKAEADPAYAALVVDTGGVAAYPAVVVAGGDYRGTVTTAAHEWTHHYLAPFPLGRAYFEGGDARVINETVADVVGAEVSKLVFEEWGTPEIQSSAPAATRPLVNADPILRALRIEVDSLLAAGQIDTAEQRMETVRLQLAEAGYRIRRLNQAYFAWYGTYAARPDSVDPLGGQIRAVRERAGSLAHFLELIRSIHTREEVARLASE